MKVNNKRRKLSLASRINEILLLKGYTSDELGFSSLLGYYFRFRFLVSFWFQYLFERISYFSRSNKLRVWCARKTGVKIGKEVYVGNSVSFDRIFPEKISIGDNTSIGDRSFITAHANIPKYTPLKQIYPRMAGNVSIGKGVWIMPNTSIAPDVIIGDYSVIAMGSVVTKSIPPMVLAGGVPCKPLKDLSADLKDELKEMGEYDKLISIRDKMEYSD